MRSGMPSAWGPAREGGGGCAEPEGAGDRRGVDEWGLAAGKNSGALARSFGGSACEPLSP